MSGWVNLMRPTPNSFLCAICFNHTQVKDAYEDPWGEKWDMCVKCGEDEERAAIFCWMAGRYGRVRFGGTA